MGLFDLTELDVVANSACRADELVCSYRECFGTCVSKFKWTVMAGKMIILALWEHSSCALHVCLLVQV